MSMRLAQQKALALVPKVTGGASLLSSLVVISLLVRKRRRRRRQRADGDATSTGNTKKTTPVYHRLLLGMAAADVSSSFWLSLSTWPIPKSTGILWAVGNERTCTFQGFFTQFGISSPLYNVSLSVYYLLVIRYSWKEEDLRKIEPWLHVLPVGWAASTALAGLGVDLFHSANLWCFIAPNSDDSNNANIYRWAFFYGPLWTAILIVTIQLFLVFSRVRSVTLRSERYTRAYAERQEEYSNQQSLLETGNGGSGGGGGSSSLSRFQDEQSSILLNETESKSQQPNISNHTENSSGVMASDPTTNQHYSSTNFTNSLPIDLPSPPAGDETSSPPPPAPASRRRRLSWSLRTSLLGNHTASTAAITSNKKKKKRQQTHEQFAKRRRQVAMQCLRYACVFYLTWIPITLIRIFQTVDRPINYWLLVLAAVATPMQGLPNCLVFLYPTYLAAAAKRRKRNKRQQGAGGGRNTNPATSAENNREAVGRSGRLATRIPNDSSAYNNNNNDDNNSNSNNHTDGRSQNTINNGTSISIIGFCKSLISQQDVVPTTSSISQIDRGDPVGENDDEDNNLEDEEDGDEDGDEDEDDISTISDPASINIHVELSRELTAKSNGNLSKNHDDVTNNKGRTTAVARKAPVMTRPTPLEPYEEERDAASNA
jgi:hypothetical protein